MDRLNIFMFKSKYGGDAYEKEFSDFLRKIPSLSPQIFQYQRFGGCKTAISLMKMAARFYTSRGTSIRPFGTCLFKRNTIIIFHHYDLTSTPWYSKVLEFIDFRLIHMLAPLLNLKIVLVSRHWHDRLSHISHKRKFLIYNDIKFEDRKYDRYSIAEKYNLDANKKWVLFGGTSEKKGGVSVLGDLSEKFFDEFEVIFTGSNPSMPQSKVKYIWVSAEDWWSFLSLLSAGVFLSRMKEGWCRMAHECILARVPVLGSGSGGMGELLELFSQKKLMGAANLEYEIRQISELPISCDIDEKQNYLATVSKRSLTALIESIQS